MATWQMRPVQLWDTLSLESRGREQEEVEMEEEQRLPSSYYVDESDPDVLILRRQDGAFVAAFNAQGATREGIRQAAMEDYRGALIEAHTDPSLDPSATE